MVATSSQRAVCTLLFLMAELYRCSSAVDDVREGVLVRAGSALPSVCMGCTIYCLSGVIIRETHLLRDKLSGVHMLGWKPLPPCPLPSPVSELVLLPRPCLPRMEVFGGRVFTERGNTIIIVVEERWVYGVWETANPISSSSRSAPRSCCQLTP